MAIVSIFIFISFVIHIFCYIHISKYEKNYINFLFPYFLGVIPVSFILEPLSLFYEGLQGSLFAYMFTYSTYATIVFFITVGYMSLRKNVILSLPFSKVRSRNLYIATIIFIIAFLFYLPVLIEFREFIFEPREIYIRTRTGYGIYFFISTLLSFVSVILFLFSKKNKPLLLIGFLIVNAIFIYLHGSKGQIINLILIPLLYFCYTKGFRVNIKKFTVILAGSASIIISLFYFTTSYDYDNIFKLLIGYSDYNRNGMMIMDKQEKTFNGQIVIESNFYSRIPRAIMPDKPKNYGVFRLAKIYFPEWFEADTGYPAFGLGIQYADFGMWSIIYHAIAGFMTGILTKIFINRVKKYHTPGDFIVFLFLSGIVLIPLGDGYLLPEHLLMGLFFNMLLAFKFKYESFN